MTLLKMFLVVVERKRGKGYQGSKENYERKTFVDTDMSY